MKLSVIFVQKGVFFLNEVVSKGVWILYTLSLMSNEDLWITALYTVQ